MSLARIAFAVGSTVGARRVVRTIQNVGVDDVLGTIGLQRRRSTLNKVLPALGLVGLGTIIGAGAALVLAPSSGRELRARVSDQLDEAKTRMSKELHTMEQAASEGMARPNNGNPS